MTNFTSVDVLRKGQVALTFDKETIYYQCNANGVSDDRERIKNILKTAVANMPATVEFGIGDFAVSDGIVLRPPANSSGLTIKGQGANVTKLNWVGGSNPTEYFLLQVKPEGTPSATDSSTWVTDVVIEDIGFKDSDPFLHQTRNGITGSATGGSTTTLSVSSAPFTAGAFDEAAGSARFYIANETTGAVARIVSNTTDTVTFDALLIGSRANFQSGDNYSINSVVTDETLGLIQQVEETHAISMQYCKDVAIRNCHAESIGDEAFNLTHVKRGNIEGNTTINCPSISFGGGAITVQHGCEDIIISNNKLAGGTTFDTNSIFDGSQGINIEALALQGIKNISISGNKIRGFGAEAININSSFTGTTVKGIAIEGNNINNNYNGIGRLGGQPLSDVTIIGNTIIDTTNYGINIDGTPSQTNGWIICDNTIATCGTGGMQLNMSDTLLSNNVFKDCPRGIFIYDGEQINISSGVFIGCGGTNLEEIEDNTTSDSTTIVSNVIIKGSLSTSVSIKGVHSFSNSLIQARSAAVNPQNAVLDVPHVNGNTIAGGVACLAGYDGGIVSNNKIKYVPTSGAQDGINVKSGCSNTVISGNTIDLTGGASNSACIDIDLGATNTLLVGNNLKSKDSGLDDSLIDDGTDTIADFVTNNISS